MDGARNGSGPSASGAGSKGPRVPPPPAVTPRPATETTVVTRHPRAKSAGPAEPHELLPTLRLPPVDAGAVRAQVQAKAREAAARGEAERRDTAEARPAEAPATEAIVASDAITDADAARASDAAATETSADASTQPADAAAAAADVDPSSLQREHAPTIRVQSLQAAGLVGAEEANAPGSRLAAMPRHPGVKRKPLPLPDVLRQGPKSLPRNAAAMPPAAEPIAAHVPEPVVEIDTASLVVDIASALAPPEPPPAPITFEPPQRPPEQREPVALAGADAVSLATSLPHARPDTGAVTIAVRPRRSRAWMAAAAIGVLAVGALGYWGLRSHEPAPTVAASLPAAGETIEAAARDVVAPTPEPAVALPPAPVEPPPVAPTAPPLVAPVEPPAAAPQQAVPPPQAAEPTPSVDAAADADDDVPAVEAAPAPAPARAPKRSTKRAPKTRESKPAAAREPAVAAKAPPTPAAAAPDRAALLREAEQAFADGRWATALRNAERVLGLGNDARAARIAALSACKLRRADAAQRAFDRLPLGQRRSVRNSCRDAGVKVGGI